MKKFSFRRFLDGVIGSKHLPVKQRKNYLTSDEFEKIAVVERKISSYQRGRVRYQGTYWYARVNQNLCILPDTRVFVIAQEGLTLVVEPLPFFEKRGGKNIDAEIPNLHVINEQAIAGKSFYQP